MPTEGLNFQKKTNAVIIQKSFGFPLHNQMINDTNKKIPVMNKILFEPPSAKKYGITRMPAAATTDKRTTLKRNFFQAKPSLTLSSVTHKITITAVSMGIMPAPAKIYG